MIEYKIISTGSKGNCVVIGDIMVDCGLPFKRIKDHLYNVKTLLLTHIHSDHIKSSTLKSIVAMFPHIQIFANYEVAQVFSDYPIRVVNAGNTFTSQGIDITPFECFHDVVTYGFTWYVAGERVIYATDTMNLSKAPLGKYDYFFIESNHDEAKLEAVRNSRSSYGYNVYAGGMRHLSTQKARAFYYGRRQSRESEFIELHQSTRFY